MEYRYKETKIKKAEISTIKPVVVETKQEQVVVVKVEMTAQQKMENEKLEQEFLENLELVKEDEYEHEIELNDAARKRYSQRVDRMQQAVQKKYPKLNFDENGKLVRWF